MTIATTMRAVQYHAYGSADVLVVDEVWRPEPGEGQVLVRVHAAGVNPVDWNLRTGNYHDVYPLELPYIPGMDFAGVVEAVGSGAIPFRTGDAVFGVAPGSHAEYVVAPAADLALKPRRLSFEEAAAVPLGALTARTGLYEIANLKPGQRVLVHAAAGGVGLFAVQLAARQGAEVIGTASRGNLELVRSLGAQTVVDYTSQAFEDAARDVDVVMDTVGGEVQDRSWQVLKPGGILLAVTGLNPDSEERARERGVRATYFIGADDNCGGTLSEIAALIEAGELRPLVQEVLPLEEARRAHRRLETRRGAGRIVLQVDRDSSVGAAASR
jgi:NADPH:quinone reductase-like Zn-dependent oxidoreductase